MAYLQAFVTVCLLLVSVTIANSGCPHGWMVPPESSSCYMVVHSVLTPYPSAKQRCESHDSHLAFPSIASDRMWLSSLLNLIDKHTKSSGYWIGLDNAAGRWTTWNGLTPEPSEIFHSPPSARTDRAAFLSQGQVMDEFRMEFKNFVCQRDKDAPMYCDTDDEWEYMSGSCYKLFLQGHTTWTDGQSICEDQNAHLPVVRTVRDIHFSQDRAWSVQGDIWLGLRRDLNDTALSWVDGHGLRGLPQNWKTEATTMSALRLSSISDPQCAYVSGMTSGGWDVYPCDMGIYVMCQRQAGFCPRGWRRYGDQCYRPVEVPMSKSLASSFCKDVHNASLLVIQSARENRVLNPLLTQEFSRTNTFVWLGVTGTPNGTLVWDNGDAVTFHNMRSEQQSRLGHETKCVTVGEEIDMWKPDLQWYVADSCESNARFICQQPVSTTSWLTPHTQDAQLHCPQGWHLMGSQCYRVLEEAHNWQDAQKACGRLEAHLATSTSPQEQYSLSYIAARYSEDLWIGMQYFHEDNEYRWEVSGERLGDFTYWDNSNNQNPSTSSCVQILGGHFSRTTGHWRQMVCSSRNRPVCQKPALPSSATESKDETLDAEEEVPLEVSIRCGLGWQERPGSPYCYLIVDLWRSYLEAQSYCEHRDANLASVTSAAEQDFLAGKVRTLGDFVWIGALLWNDDSAWEWSDYSPFSFVNWNKHDTVLARQDCVAMAARDGSWFTEDCYARNAFVCKKMAPDALNNTETSPDPTATLAIDSLSCEEGWVASRNACFLYKVALVTWAEAHDLCKKKGSRLATIEVEQDNDVLWGSLGQESRGEFWIGLSAENDRKTFRWESGANVTYTNWDARQPSYMSTTESSNATGCVSISTMSGRWLVEDCWFRLEGYVCSKPATVSNASVPNYHAAGCPQGALAFGHLCYVMETDARTWPRAEERCQTQNGTLATPADWWEQAFLWGEVAARLGGESWLGGHKHTVQSDFSTSSGASLSFTNWNGPDSLYNVGCVVMLSDGFWNVSDCLVSRPFVCEIVREGYEIPSPAPSTTTSTKPQATAAVPEELTCEAHWTRVLDRCYKIRILALPWHMAQQVCRERGGHLASLHNATQFLALRQLLSKSALTSRAVWIGAQSNDENRLVWSDGSPLTYFPRRLEGFGNTRCWTMTKYHNMVESTSCHFGRSSLCYKTLGFHPKLTNSSPEVSTTSAHHVTLTVVPMATAKAPSTTTTTTTTTSTTSATSRPANAPTPLEKGDGQDQTFGTTAYIVGGLLGSAAFLLLASLLALFLWRRARPAPASTVQQSNSTIDNGHGPFPNGHVPDDVELTDMDYNAVPEVDEMNPARPFEEANARY